MRNNIHIGKYLFFLLSLLLNTSNISAAELKALVIESVNDQSQTIIPGIKAQYDLCVQIKEIQQKTKREYPQIWPSMKKSLKPGYNVDAKPANEPDWQGLGVGITTHKEYFHGNHYAKYKQLKKYTISEDGYCALTIEKSESREIDNGKHRYLINMKGYITNAGSVSGSSTSPPYKKIKVSRYVSPVITRIENDREINQLVNDQPEVIRYLNTLLDSGANHISGTSPGISRDTVDILRKSFGIEEDKGDPNVQIPRAGDENFVLGYICDIVSSTSFKTRQWYYKRMHHYPSIMKRPIILRSEVTLGKRVAIKEATRFQFLDRLDDKIFIPPQEK